MDYLRIAVCDDESIDLSNTMELLKSYDSEQQLHIITYMSANDLLSSIKKNPFDIVLMDIEMEPLF